MPYITLFLVTLFLGTVMSLSGTHWVFVWLGLELNLLSFIPLLTSSTFFHSSDAAMKYFLAQALGSGLILLGATTMFISPFISLPSYFPFLLFIGLLTKLGLPPCHFWFPSVMSMISWPLCILLSTWQKLTPMLMLFTTLQPTPMFFLTVCVILGALVGGLGGMNQTHLRPLLAYSSIGHMTWMLAASTVSILSSLLYLFIYIITTIPLMLLLNSSSSNSNISSMNITSHTPLYSLNMLLLVCSLGGLPPLLGFFPKWLVIQSLSSSFTLILFFTLLGSMLNLYYYLNLIFINTLTPLKLPLIFLSSSSSTPSIMPLVVTLTLGVSPSLLLFFYALTILH